MCLVICNWDAHVTWPITSKAFELVEPSRCPATAVVDDKGGVRAGTKHFLKLSSSFCQRATFRQWPECPLPLSEDVGALNQQCRRNSGSGRRFGGGAGIPPAQSERRLLPQFQLLLVIGIICWFWCCHHFSCALCCIMTWHHIMMIWYYMMRIISWRNHIMYIISYHVIQSDLVFMLCLFLNKHNTKTRSLFKIIMQLPKCVLSNELTNMDGKFS